MRHHGKLASIVALGLALAASGAAAQNAPADGSPEAEPRPRASRTRPANVAKACEVDIAIFCGDIEAKNGNAFRCLSESVALVSPACSAEMSSKKR